LSTKFPDRASRLTKLFSRSNDSWNSLQIGFCLNLRPACKVALYLFFNGVSDLGHEPTAGFECFVGLGNQASIDVHSFPTGKHGDFWFELAHLFLDFVGLRFSYIR